MLRSLLRHASCITSMMIPSGCAEYFEASLGACCLRDGQAVQAEGSVLCRKQLGPKVIGSGALIGLGSWALCSGAVSMQMLAGAPSA